MKTEQGERGSALLGVVLVTVILSMLGTVSLNLAVQEIREARAAGEEATAQHLAEAGLDLIVQWFHDPSSQPSGSIGSLFNKQFDLVESGPSFFDPSGRSQFSGTNTSPDILYDASHVSDDKVLNDPSSGWFRQLGSLGRILKLKIYGPARPGLLCTLEVTAAVRELTRTVSMQIGTLSIPSLRAGVQIENSGVTGVPPILPVLLHWGTMKIKGDALLGGAEELPVKTALASVTGQSYFEASGREDRWFEVLIGGNAFFDPSSKTSVAPSNVYSQQDPMPGLHYDRWDYETMKRYALTYGTYYARDTSGLLYRNGMIVAGAGITPDQALSSESVGDHRGLVFIDTLDQRPPNSQNLGFLDMETEYAEGLFIVQAHVRLTASGAGKSVPALSPPSGTTTSLGTRIPVTLSKVHINGVLFVGGNLSYAGEPRLSGALVVGGKIESSQAQRPLEIWYNYDLKGGFFRGLPLVYAARGTWQEKY